MWLSDDLDFFSNTVSAIPYYMFLTLSLVILLSPVDPAKAAQNFIAYRLTQYDALDSTIGSRIAQLSCDFQTISMRTYARRCVMMKLAEVSMDNIRNAINNNAGGIVIVLPVTGWTEDLTSHWLTLESELVAEAVQIPIYFTTATDNLESLYSDLQKHSHKSEKTGGLSLLDSIFSTSYRGFTTGPKATELKNMELINLEGRLTSSRFDVKKPTIVLSAYYDAGGAIPSLAYGADANAAGVTVLLETARILSQLTDVKNVPRYNIVFLLTGGGKQNFLGAKRWLETNVEDPNGLVLLDSVVQVISLEGLGTNLDDVLRLHVSRLPKEGTFSQRLVSALETAAKLHPSSATSSDAPVSPIDVVHKKINLNQYDLSWEHERFSLHRLSTATLSAWPSATSYKFRNSALDGGPLSGQDTKFASRGFWGPVKSGVVARNARVLTEALVHLIYDMDTSKDNFTFVEPSWCTETSVSGLLDLLTMRPRSSQLLTPPPLSTPSASSRNQATSSVGLIGSLEQYMRSIMSEVRLTRHHFASVKAASMAGGQHHQDKNTPNSAGGPADKGSDQVSSISAASKDPEITFYSGVSPQKVTIYRLKSSVFDLVVACCIGTYLSLVYFLVEHFGKFYDFATRLATGSEKKLKSL